MFALLALRGDIIMPNDVAPSGLPNLRHYSTRLEWAVPILWKMAPLQGWFHLVTDGVASWNKFKISTNLVLI